MEILSFIFRLGVAFSIFNFLWYLIVFVVKRIAEELGSKSQVQDYILRIIKYFMLVSVTAHYLAVYDNGEPYVDLMNMVVGIIVLGLYLMGKLQRRAMLSMLSNHPMLSRFTSKIDPKIEKFLLIGSVIYFAVCLQFPQMVNNGVMRWFESAIEGIYDTPVIGWIFAVVAFFFLINILFRGANVIGSLLTGQPINSGPKGMGGFGPGAGGGANPFDQFRQKQREEEDFVDYEDVTDQEDEQ